LPRIGQRLEQMQKREHSLQFSIGSRRH
jgi:hypothetical protein